MKDATLLFIQTGGTLQELTRTLKSLDIRNEGFQAPKDFLNRLKEKKTKVCVIDLTFQDAPVMIAMIKSIRSVLGPKLAVLVLISPEDRALTAQALAAGASDAIEKPVQRDLLQATLAKYLSKAPKSLPKIEIPGIIQWFFTRLSPAMAGLNSALTDEADNEVQVRFYAERLIPQRAEFLNMISSLRKSETKPDLYQSIRMYGLRNTRELVVATQLSNVTGGKLIGWNPKTGVLNAKPSQLIQFAAKTVEKFGEDSRYQHVAFRSGLILDLLFVLAEETDARKTSIRKFLQERHEQALKRIIKCFDAAKTANHLTLERHIITAHLMAEAGKVAMAMFFPDYLELRAKMDKKSLSPVLQHIVEMQKYNVSYNILAALISQGAPGLGEAHKAILFFDYDFMLKDDPSASNDFDLIKVCQV